MSLSDWIVIAAGAAGIAWVNWYFFFARRPESVAKTAGSGAQEIGIQVKGGYEPSVIHVRRGTPVRLIFDRQEASSCSEEVVLGALGIRKFLPAFQKTVVELTPKESGTFDFTCGMGMLHGKLIVE